MRINNNMMAMNTHRQMGVVNSSQSKSMEKLSSGYRINRAGDDAAGLAISEKMRSQIKGLDQASRNAQDSISLVQTAEGALNETQNILQRMRELAVQSANDTNVDEDRTAIQNEMDQLATEITRISNDTEFNTRNLLNGGLDDANLGDLTFHIGANSGQKMELSIGAMDAFSLGVAADYSSTTATVSTSTDVTEATVGDSPGTAIVDGATLTLSAVDVAADGTTGAVGGLTITTDNNTSELNGVNITYADGGDGTAESASWDSATNTLTVTGDFDDTDTNGTFSSAANLTTAINTALSGAGFTEAVTVTGTAGTGTDAQSGTIENGLGANEVALTIGSETQIVADTATSVTFTSAANAGLSLTLDGSLTAASAAGTIDIAQTTVTAATASFDSDGNTTDATAAAGIDITTQTAADAAITTINDAITQVSDERAKLGAVQNRLEHTIANLDTSAENLQASESRIRDVDMAKEMMEYTKNNILSQAAQSMLAQANQAPQGVLQLLR